MNYLGLISSRGGRLPQYSLWLGLTLVAGIPRILGAFLLPNEEGDPHSYLQAIEMMRASIVGGTFTVSELFGFWLPLYQFICALISVVVGQPLYVAKVVSAVCGTGVCLLVFGVSMHLTANRMLSLSAFTLIALNPIHVMYSAFSLSDVPHAFLVMSSLYLALRNRWVLAASLVAAGGLMRPESWMFIVLLPALQWFLHRRVTPAAFFIALSAPVVWIYISWSATGDPLEYFKVRNNYIRELLSENPDLAVFSASSVLANLKTLLYSSGPAVIIACFLAAWLLIKRRARQPNWLSTESSRAVAVTTAFFFSSLGFLLFAYFTMNQPAIFARYCLALFAMGLPVIAWIFLEARKWKVVWARGLRGLLVLLCLWQWTVQLRDGVGYISHASQKRMAGNDQRENLKGSVNLSRRLVVSFAQQGDNRNVRSSSQVGL